ncbi:MAG: 1-acyl-sn-glycerol-3-phosphate acyltransferase [Myxococcota bacterium]|jgi:1-acyl-sn-glycerol-3-phosphate acyltransferase
MSQSTAPRSRIVRWIQGDSGTRWGAGPEQYDEAASRILHRRMGRIFGEGRYFGLKVDGWENLPADDNVLAVSNHSGGTTVLDGFGLWYAWQERFGFSRPGHVMAHEMIFAADGPGRMFAQLGAVRADRTMAVDVLKNWKRDLIVMPGGDRDTWRPWKDRYKVNFAGRTGYAKIAIKAGVSIVPIANAGAQSTLMVLTDGAPLARAMGLPKLARAEVFPISLSFPWGLTIGPLPHLPPPTTLRYKIGAPIAPPITVAEGEEPPAWAVAQLDAQVQAAVQSMLNELKEESRPRQVIRQLRRRSVALLDGVRGSELLMAAK